MLNITLKDLLEAIGTGRSAVDTSFVIGEKYLIRTVTMHYTGRVKEVNAYNIVLDDAAWIGDTGRYSNALVTGELSEVEPYPDGVCVQLAVIVDFARWSHDLPRDVK